MTPPQGSGISVAKNNTGLKQGEQQENKESLSLFVDPESYTKAERKARWYLKEIKEIARNDDYLSGLTGDYKKWSKESTKLENKAGLSELERKLQSDSGISSLSFLQKLSVNNQLNEYLTKSIAYLFMRDLGKSLNDKQTDKTIKKLVSRIQKWVSKQPSSSEKQLVDNHFITSKAKEYGVNETLNWLKAKLSTIQDKMPEELDKTNGLRKLVKIIAGVVLHRFIDMPSNKSKGLIARELDQAIRLGYCYGLTYPFIDDLQDSSNALSNNEKTLFNQAIRNSLLTGSVVEFPEFSKAHQKKMRFVYEELSDAFEYIKSCQSSEQARIFFEQAFVFFEAQDIDRQRRLSDKQYSDEELFLPIILKSAGCRLIAKEIVDSECNEDFDYRTFCFGIYNQFNDDIKDIFDDLEEGNVTPYSYFISTNGASSNPYRIYWAVVNYLISKVYKSEPRTKKLFLERCINAHKSLKNSIGGNRYQKLERTLLKTGNSEFDSLISELVNSPNNVAWFDKLVSREVSNFFDNQEKAKEKFKTEYIDSQKFVEENLNLAEHKRVGKTQLVESANYSLNAGGKRFRSVLALNTMTERYGFSQEESIPVLKLLEYMHTASLIFDDKPSQDNAPLRRGKPALHVHCKSEAKAELTGVYLMMKAVEVQSTIRTVNSDRVLESLEYAANTTQAICEGQILDLQSNHATDLDSLERLSFLKTGLAIEAAFLIPAILAGENDIEKEHLKRFAKYLGLVFQLRDDLLDHESCEDEIGKPISQDLDNKKASFVTILGIDDAKSLLFDYVERAQESLSKLNKKSDFYELALELVANRSN